METKVCTKCGEEKPLDDFGKRKQRKKNSRHSWCEVCFREYKQEYWLKNKAELTAKRKIRYEKNRDRYRATMKRYYENSDRKEWRDKCWANKILREYGLTVDDYNALFAKQNGLCAICDRPETHRHKGTTVRLAVDHCHVTGLVRGLLCRSCNVGIGLLEHSLARLDQAKVYLQNSDQELKLKVDFPDATVDQKP